MNYLSHAFHCKQRRAHINDINILNLLLFYITWGKHNIVLVVTTSTVLILICYVLIIILAAYLVSFLNLLNRVQSCNENHLLLGNNCEEDHPLMKAYTQHLTKEMEEVENKVLTTEKGYQVRFAIKLIASDMKWASSFSGELNNAATYFSPFANFSQSNKHTMFGSIGGSDATWQPWSYEKRLEVARKVQNFKKRLKDPDKKQRGEVTKFIAQNKSR